MATATPSKPTYPRPPIQWAGLFQEPVYTDGQPYEAESTDDDTDPDSRSPA